MKDVKMGVTTPPKHFNTTLKEKNWGGNAKIHTIKRYLLNQ